MKRAWLLTPVILALVAIASYSIFVFLAPQELPEGIVYANGRIEGTEIRVSAEVAGRVVDSHIQEGGQVTAGDLLFELDTEDYTSRLDQARANAKALEQELRSLSHERDTWQHHLQTATENLNRLSSLRDQEIVTQQQLEAAEDRHTEAAGRVRQLDAGIANAEAQLDAAQQNLELLSNQLAKTRITAPITGTVLIKAVEGGEYSAIGQPVAVLVDMTDLELKVYIPESDLGKINVGNPVRVRVDAFPQRLFDGAVSRIDQHAQFTPKDVHMPSERSRMVFGVEIAVDNADGYLKPGMPADAWIRWKDGMPWPEDLPVPGA